MLFCENSQWNKTHQVKYTYDGETVDSNFDIIERWNRDTQTKHNKEEGVKDTGSKLYLIGNVKKKDGETVKRQELFIGDFFNLAQEGKANVADEAEQAVIFLTDTDFWW